MSTSIMLIPGVHSDMVPKMSKRNKTETTADDGKVIIIRLWPKTPVLYPMAILALICGIVSQIFGVPVELTDAGNAAPPPAAVEPGSEPAPPAEAPDSNTEPGAAPAPAGEDAVAPLAFAKDVDRSQSGLVNTILAVVFLIMSAFSLFVVCIDFEVRWSLLIFVVCMLVLMGALLADKMGYISLPDALAIFSNFTLYATPLFYYCVFAIWILLMIVSATIARLHYVRVEHNEVVVVSGILEQQKRMSTFRMHYTKEIQDVFEYYLPFVRSGRLIFTFPNEEQPLIMDNVIGLNRVLKRLDRKSSSFQVTNSSD